MMHQILCVLQPLSHVTLKPNFGQIY